MPTISGLSPPSLDVGERLNRSPPQDSGRNLLDRKTRNAQAVAR